MKKDLALHARQRKLLSLLNAKHGVETGKELSAKLGVSERTVRNDIAEINARLKEYGIQILPRYGKGYILEVRDRSIYIELFSQKESYITKDDRSRTLMLRLIRENDWYNLGNLEDEMFVSRTTLENDIRTIRKRVTKRYPYLEIERQGNFIKFENDEIKKRTLLIRLYVENWDYDSREGIVLRQDEFEPDALARIQKVLKQAVYKRDIKLDDFGLIYLVLSVAVLYLRVKSGHYVGYICRGRRESETVREILSALSTEWNMILPHAEYVWLSDILEQIQILNTQNYSKNYVLEHTSIFCHQIVNRVLKQIEDQYAMDFTGDDKLFVDLSLHVQALTNGIVAPQFQHHMIGDELRNRYPFMGDIAHFLRQQLEEECGMELWKDEEDYLLPFLISAQRNLYAQKRGNGIPTAVISHFNGSLTHFLMEQLRKFYGDVMDLRGPFPIHAKENAKMEQPLLILTTVRMKDFRRLFDAPVITVSALLEQEDRKRVEYWLTNMKCQLLYPAMQRPVRDYFREDLIYCLQNKESLSSAIAAIQDKLYERNDMVEKIAVDLENDFYTVLPGGFVFLYQLDAHIQDTVISLVELERIISWKHVRNIRAIMFMALRPDERKLLGWFYHLAFVLAEDSNRFASALKAETIEDISRLGEK